MDLFHLDWERTFEALVRIIGLSFVVERAGHYRNPNHYLKHQG
jgi:hypothetical protein